MGQEDPLEKEMAIYFSIFAWKIPWTEEPGGLHTVHEVSNSALGFHILTFNSGAQVLSLQSDSPCPGLALGF